MIVALFGDIQLLVGVEDQSGGRAEPSWFRAADTPLAEEVLLLDVGAVEFNVGVEDGYAVEPLVGNVCESVAVDGYGGGPDESTVGLAVAAELSDFVLVDGYFIYAEDPLAVVAAVDDVQDVFGVQAQVDGIVEDSGVADGVAVGELSAANGYWLQGLSPMWVEGRFEDRLYVILWAGWGVGSG